jgi:hypothetical protein
MVTGNRRFRKRSNICRGASIGAETPGENFGRQLRRSARSRPFSAGLFLRQCVPFPANQKCGILKRERNMIRFDEADDLIDICLDNVFKAVFARLDRVIEKPARAMSRSEQWGIFFRYLKDKSRREKINEVMAIEEGIAMASEVLLRISRDEAERVRLMSEYKYVVDTQSKVVQAEREGAHTKALEVGRKLKSWGIAAEQIAEATGLALEQIAEL